jgi:rhamnulokinase
MSQFYVACNLGVDNGRVLLGNLQNGRLQVSEVRRFANVPVVERNSVQWNIPQLYQDILDALRTIASYEEPVQSISCSSFACDYLLLDHEGALLTPTLHRSDAQAQAVREKMAGTIPWGTISQETGTQPLMPNMFLQLGAESGRRLKHARFVLSMADGFNFLLGGAAMMESSMASATQLYNPVTKQWSEPVLQALKIPTNLLPPIVPAGTVLGDLREAICKETGLEETRVVASCSEELCAVVSGLPAADTESSAFLRQGDLSVLGMSLPQPLGVENGQRTTFSNYAAYGSTFVHKYCNGLQILSECQRFWAEKDRSMDNEMLSHLAGSATPFESLIDPSDARFYQSGDMPLRIQAFCKETNQPIPRKPGPVYRCVLESLALHYRKILQELELLSGTHVDRLYVPAEGSTMLLNHFTANALQRPLTVVSGDLQGLGSIVVQALALGDLHSLEEAHAVLRASCKVQTIVPHAHLWQDAYDRFVSLLTETAAPATTTT